MAISTQIQNLNLIPGKSAPVVVHLSQGNVGNTVQFYLYDGDNPYYPTNVSIAVHGVRADNTVFGPYTVSVTSGSNLVSFDIVTAMTSVTGAAIGELVITDGNQNQIGSANFGMLVEETPYSSSVTYEDDLSIYQRILAYVQSIPAELQSEISTERAERIAAVNAEASTRDAAINTEANTRATADTNLQAQINQIIAPSGEAPSAAEVQNARIAANGTTYSTLGDAIRSQVSELGDEINEKATETIGYVLLEKTSEKIEVNVSGSVFSVDSNENYYLPVKPGDAIDIVAGSQPVYVAFFKQDPLDNVGGTVSYSSTYTNKIYHVAYQKASYIVPSDSITLYVQHILDNVDRTPAVLAINGYDISKRVCESITDIINGISDFSDQTLTLEPGILTKIDLSTMSNDTYTTARCPVSRGDKLKITGTNSIANFPLYIFTKNGAVVNYARDLSNQTNYVDYEVTVAEDADTIIVNRNTAAEGDVDIRVKKLEMISWEGCRDYVDEELELNGMSYWKDKKIVWFGTSIPAGVVNAGDSGGSGSYPVRLGEMLGATMYNESIGSSEVRAGTHGDRVTSDDPMGYGGVSGPGLMLSLSLSSSEKQEIYDNWDSKWKNIITWYSDQIDMSKIQTYKNSSWDVILTKYLSGGSVGQCDLYVFDHGYNDGERDAKFRELADIPDNLTDRRYWFGAMGYLFSKIYADNPKARIVIVGHYSTNQWSGDSKTSYVCEAQEALAKYWSIPIIKTWEHIGFSFMSVTEGGETIVPAISWLPDGIHPASDLTGKSLQHYAQVLYPLFRDLR